MVKKKRDGDESDEDVAGNDSSTDESDSDSDDETAMSTYRGVPPPDIDGVETSANQLSLVDDDNLPSLILQPPPELGEEDEGEGAYEVYGEGDVEEPTGRTTADTNKTITESETELDKSKKKKKKRKKTYFINLTSCKYESVRRMSKKYGFKEVTDDDAQDWHLFWTDYSVALERVMDMKKYQKINHFPGMSEICRKDLLARNMNRMLKLFPKEYNVFPRSWCLPADYGDFQAFTRQKKHKTYILKPESGCQGKGIWVTKNPKEIKAQEHQLCQQYLSKPFLIDGFKFDLRIYVLVSSCDPFRIFVFKDGLARFATTKYVEPNHNNTANVFMHLTNYAINKTSNDFIRDDEAGSKRRITTTNKWLEQNGYDLDKMWRDIDDCIIKTLISCHSILKHNYRTCFPNHVRGSACFEILGFDIMMDKKLKPYLLEVNHSPSFHTDAKLDKEIKEALLFDTLNLVNFGAVDKRKCIEEERRKIKERLFQRKNKQESKEDFDKAQLKWQDEAMLYEDAHLGNFRRIYPAEGTEKYEKYFHSSGSLYQETAAFKARSEAARQQREEISRKQEKLESMLKKKKDNLARPESPGSRRKRVTRRPNMPQRKLIPGREPYGSDPYKRDPGQEPLDTLRPVEIMEDEELERISGLLQRDNLVRGLGIVEHVYRLLHCTPGTMGIQLKNDHKYNYNPEDPSTHGNRAAVNPNDNNYITTTNNQGYNNNNNSSGIGTRPYQQVAAGISPYQAVREVKGRLQTQTFGQTNDRNMPANLHRTRYTNRKVAPPGGSRSGNPMVITEIKNKYDAINAGILSSMLKNLGAKGTPRGGTLPYQTSHTPPSLGPHQGAPHLVPQYQYSFPHVHSKITASNQHASQQMVPQPAGLAVVSAPAPMAQRPEGPPSGSHGVRTAFTNQPSLEGLQRNGKISSGSRIRASPGGTNKLKELEMRGNQAAVLS